MHTVQRPDPTTIHLRIPLRASRTEEGLGEALHLLGVAARDLPRLVAESDDDAPTFLLVTFHTPEKRWLSERRFFERCAKLPRLAAATVEYLRRVNPSLWPDDPFGRAGYWTSTSAPAGSHAIVPLVLRSDEHVDALIEHLRGVDLGHETFQGHLICEVVRRHGLDERTLRLIAYRCCDGFGQTQDFLRDVRWLLDHGGLRDRLAAEGGVTAMARLVDEVSLRDPRTQWIPNGGLLYRGLYMASAGQALFAGEPEKLAVWLRYFEDRGLAFDERNRELRAPEPAKPLRFEEEWEEAASCTDRG